MRNHYMPQKYLSRFSVGPKSGLVWQYDLQLDTFQKLAPKSIGVFTDWFSQLTEIEQAAIESAAIEPMDKLADFHQQLNEDERKMVCAYIASMIQRIPPGRESALTIIDKSYENLMNNPELVYEETGVQTDVVEMAFAQFELDGTRERIIKEDSKLILDLPQFEDALNKMQWTVLLAEGTHHFITSDAPVYWDKPRGIGQSGAELTFPISSKAVLYLCNRPSNRNIKFTQASDKVHTQLNRRAVYYSARFIFSSKDDKWVKELAHHRIKPPGQLAKAIRG